MSLFDCDKCIPTCLRDNHASEWDAIYNSTELTDWELISPADLRGALVALNMIDGDINTAIEVGCGRGLRTLAAILSLNAFNRNGFKLTGIDHSDSAVDMARSFCWSLRQGGAIPEPFSGFFARHVPDNPGLLRADIQFKNGDLFNFLEGDGDCVDLIIDWMCLHEIAPEKRPHYANLITRNCAKYFMLNTFSVEGATRHDLGYVGATIRKYQLSTSDVRELFGGEFDIIYSHLFPEDLYPQETPSDGIVAAKMLYILKRRRAV